MGSVDFQTLASDILRLVGGGENLVSYTHCATRLRLNLSDESKADTAAIKELDGVIAVRHPNGQYQIVIGNEVPELFAQFAALVGDDAAAVAVDERRGGPLARFIALFSAVMQPIVWALTGLGMVKAVLSALAAFEIIKTESPTYAILSAGADGMFYFLPVFLALAASKWLKTDMVTSVAIAVALLHPSIASLAEAGTSVSFFGLPVVMLTYANSFIPIFLAMWLQSYMERGLNKVLPDAVRDVVRPMIVITVMVPLVLITMGPATVHTSNLLTNLITGFFGDTPWLAGFILGGLWELFVIFGLHWGLILHITNELASGGGHTLITGPLVASVVAQSAATLAVVFRSRSNKRRGVAVPAALSGLLAGVTEPAVYGVNLPLRRPFYFGLLGGAIGGAIAASGGSGSDSFAVPSLLGLKDFTEVGDFTLEIAGTAAAAIIAFVLTLVFAPRERRDVKSSDHSPETALIRLPGAGPITGSNPIVSKVVTSSEETSTSSIPMTATSAIPLAMAAADEGAVEIRCPVRGRSIPLSEVTDPVVAAGLLGKGVAIAPEEGRVCAPVSGELVTGEDSDHAYGIRTAEGVEVLVHVGINTVELRGEHFYRVVAPSGYVEAGDILVDVDFPSVEAAGYDNTIMMTIMNTNELGEVVPASPGPKAAGDLVMVVKQKEQ
ncbi:glucose PTS transporter subunit IIA [Dermatophilus congolensis]|uniref:glucose PTS transporter subunit IIA n=1 Tax=Dermatophilus congolensis TaxID=1863 RepID=UPI001AAF0BFE|nr:glucose PTS transporter subunit IIA [Dermatophilus congolensis]MBO3142215.1 PTS transporter subunit EIIC [Dermatophilus congolensis]MBO3151207.1 PTS transporter subunit EIIC [Dermatophilus congolensis]MBO3161792.1 PTS transporter subunit EIIC [Dermatophilus congolensis]MBO3162490.1 PTS transporter subunit EIIC [Dermatophilus congolensis]MBO3176046.1 PTS transporter subunit EIIC [Dermatophilus congolensis]